jgi:hypothetical protein
METVKDLSLFERAHIDAVFERHVLIHGVFEVHRGKCRSTIEMPLTVRKDGSDFMSAVQDAEADLTDLNSHAYTSASFLHPL